MDNLGHIRLTGGKFEGSRIGKKHRFVVHAEHTESRKGYDYGSEPMSIGDRHRKPKSVVHHEFSISKVEHPKASAIKKRIGSVKLDN